MASSSTPSSSTTKKYEVFLSFSGEDTRQGFTSHLYDALCQKNIKTFRDDDELRRGVEISPALWRAIEESKIAVVIFSENYASSEWCLSELKEIIKRMKLKELIVMPVFYGVATDDVQELKGSYDCSFANEVPEEVKKWREALTEASNQAGFDSSVIRPEAELVRQIVKAVWRELRSKYKPSPSDFEGLVGIHERIEQVKALLCLDMMDVPKIIGIWGMRGVGKTTIAKAVFKSISYQFDGACIIKEVGKKLEKTGGSDRLERDVLSKVLHEENPKLGTPIRPDIMEMLNQKKVFIVLDDVDTTQILTISTLKTFVERLKNQCGLGSRIIITSWDIQNLHIFNVDDRMIYKVEGFNNDEARELFHKHANTTADCMALSEKVVDYAKGNPLALTVSGLHLKGRNKQVWESALNVLPDIVNSEVHDILKISYDGLREKEKKLFLDIACFQDYFHYLDLVKEEFLDGLEDSLSVLVSKSLITAVITETYDIEMHDLLQEMGKKIVSSEYPGSRLWELEDVTWTLNHSTETDAVEVIMLEMDDEEAEDIRLRPQVFDKMRRLRFLSFYCYLEPNKVHLSNCLTCLPNELRILNWPGYSLRELPSNFKPKNLVKLDLCYSNIKQLWKKTKIAPKLKWLILRCCKHLTRIPDLSNFPMLVEVDLSDCHKLVDFPSSAQQHNNLRNLKLHGTVIEEVPSSIQSLTNLTELDLSKCIMLKLISPSICKLKSLPTLDLTGCYQLETFPEILETMESLKSLKLCRCKEFPMALKVLPPSIELLNGLRSLTLRGCEKLDMLPSSICNLTSLEDLDLSFCSKLDELPDNLGNLKSLKKLQVEGLPIGQLPSSVTRLENLEYLDCSRCCDLTRLPPLSGFHSLQKLLSNYCSLVEIPEDIGCLSLLKVLNLAGNMFESLPISIKQLSKLEFLSLRDCKKLRSIPHLPEGLNCLGAMNCDQLCKVPDASEFVRCINSKSHFDDYYHHCVDFIFTNSLNLIKAVSNVFEEIMQRTEKGSGIPSNSFSIYLPGNKIPEWFRYKSPGSSVNFQVLRNDLVNRKFMGFAICAVLGFEEYYSRDEQNMRKQWQYIVGLDYDFKTNYDHIEICNGNRSFLTNRTDLNVVYINSDHMLLGYCSFYSSNPKKLPAGDSDCVDISIKFKIISCCGQLKCCAVHPIYAEEPIEKIDATIQEMGETSGRRSDRSDDNDEEVEPHPKRICIQAINTP